MRAATANGGAPSHPETLQDAALLHFLDQDQRPTFVLNLKTSKLLYQNPACKVTHPKLPQQDWATTFGSDENELPNIWAFGGNLWTPTVLYEKWVIFSTCCRRDEISSMSKKPLSRTTPTETQIPSLHSSESQAELNGSCCDSKSSFATQEEIEGLNLLEDSINKSLEVNGVQGPPISLAQYKRSFKTAPVGIYATDPAGNPLFCNEQYYKIIGKPKSRDSIPVLFDVIHEDYVERVKVAKRQAMVTKKPVTLEYRLKRPWNTKDPISGKVIFTEFWVLGTIVPWVDDIDPDKIHYINGWLLNISDQRYHERLRVVAAQQTRTAQRFARIADSAPVGMYLFKPDMTPVYLNQACFDIYGADRDQYMLIDGTKGSFMDYIHEDSKEDVRAATSRVLLGQPSELTYRLKKPHKYTDPSTGAELEGPTWVHAFSVAETNESGEVICVEGFVQDISAKQLSEQLLKQRLEEALETKRQADRFIDMTSHELRNPLSAILQSADGILAELERLGQNRTSTLAVETAELVVNLAQTIIHCAQHQKTIVDDILTLSKLDSNLLVISPDQVTVPKLIDRCFKMYAAETEAAKIKASLAIDTSYNKVVGENAVMLDQGRVLQVVINLFSNAIKFSKLSKMRRINVSLSASRDRPSRKCFVESHTDMAQHTLPESDWGSGEEVYIQIAVSDTGCGLEPTEQTQLFQRFHQASPKTQKQYGGSGLGLYISQSLTELQGGQIGVESAGPGQGCTFIFYIKGRLSTSTISPYALTSQESDRPRTSSPVDATAPRLGHRRISTAYFSELHVLIAEDNVVNQKVMSQQLTRFGCVVHIANHGLEALDFLQKTTLWNQTTSRPSTSEPPIPLSIVLMDVEMPVLDGLSAAKKIRALESEGKLKGHVPIIAITANARSEQLSVAREAGMDFVVTKPFRVAELVEKMREVVGNVDA